MHLDETLPDVMRFRLDDDECRFLLQRGPAEDVTALGWQIDDHATFDDILARIRATACPSPKAPPRRRRCAASSGSSASPAPTV